MIKTTTEYQIRFASVDDHYETGLVTDDILDALEELHRVKTAYPDLAQFYDVVCVTTTVSTKKVFA